MKTPFLFRILLMVFFVFFQGAAHSQVPALQWAGSIGGALSEVVHDMAQDGNGNIYITGSFSGNVDFDPGAAINNLVSNGSSDVFVLKLNAAGNFIWVKSLGGSGDDVGYAVSIDVNGNCYVTGSFKLQVDFDPCAATHNLISAGGDDAFALKLDASGNFVWAAVLGGPGASAGRDILTSDVAQLYITGSFSLTNDFDPGSGTYVLSSAGNSDGFICRLDQSGNFQWAGAMGGSGSDATLAVAVDGNGHVLTTGVFYDVADFDPGAGTAYIGASGYNDVFIAKWNDSGNFMWAKNIGGPGSDMGRDIVVDSNGSVYTTGYFMSTADFDPANGNFNMSSQGGWDMFISILDNFGNFTGAWSSGGSGDDSGNSIALDDQGNVCLAGGFNNTVDFDPGTGILQLTSAGLRDGFLSKYQSDGSFLWAFNMGGTGFDEAASLVIDTSGSIYTCGTFTGTADFDPANTANLYSAGADDIFIAKYDSDPLNVTNNYEVNNFKFYPNPASGSFTILLTSKANDFTFTLIDLAGKIIRQETVSYTNELTVSINDLAEGIYVVKLEGAKFTESNRLVVIR